MKTNQTRNKRGYTLIEILAVVAIIMMLTGIFIVAIRSSLQKGRVTNVVGTVQAISGGIADYLQKPGSSGVLPLTSSQTGATLDDALLKEGVLEKPLAIRMGNVPTSALAAGATYDTTSRTFTAGGSSQSGRARIECRLGTTLQSTFASGDNSSDTVMPVKFKLDGNTVIPGSSRVVYLVIPGVPYADAYALAAAVDGALLGSNQTGGGGSKGAVTDDDSAQANGASNGAVVFAADSVGTPTGTTTVYFYITRQ